MRPLTALAVASILAGIASHAMAQSPARSPTEALPAVSAIKPAGSSLVRRKVPDTLMFGIDELNDIQSRVASGGEVGAGGKKEATSAIENATLYLSTILYTSPTDWTIWVNGVPISPGQDFQSFRVTEIGPSFVELLVPLSAQGMRPVRLSPNQTFIAKSGAVVEGPWR